MTRAKAARTVTVRRTIAAPAAEVFDAWLDPAAMSIWMRPNGIERTDVKIEPRQGGGFEIVMLSAGGKLSHTGVYRLIDRPRRLVFTWSSPATLMTESVVTVDFHAKHDATEVVVTHEMLPNEEALQSHTDGWTQALDRLARLKE